MDSAADGPGGADEKGREMKAFLMAAGYGTRLRPVTEKIPKCLVPIHGQPLLGWWFELLRAHGVSEVLVNTHYLPETVRGFMAAYRRRHTGLLVHEAYEPRLLGSGGTIRDNRAFVQGEEAFLICYADNLTDADLTAFQAFHRGHEGVLSMALFQTNMPEQCGIAELDERQRIVHFVEKPKHPRSNLANAGMYIADQRLFDFLEDKELLDLGRDVLPGLVGRMYGWHTQGYLRDIGTLESYRQANEEWCYDYHENAAENQFHRRRDGLEGLL